MGGTVSFYLSYNEMMSYSYVENQLKEYLIVFEKIRKAKLILLDNELVRRLV